MRNKKFIRNWLILIGLLLVVFLAGRSYWNSKLEAPFPEDEDVIKVFVIAPSESTDSITQRLFEEGLIKSVFFFKLHLRQTRQAGNLQAGDFKLSPSMSVKELLEELQKGSVDKWVRLQEGWRVEEMARELNEELRIENGEFLKYAKEGYMFPDSYLFNPDVTPSDIASILRNTFDSRFTEELKSQIRAQGLTPEQGVILASIVEREGRSDKVRTEIAGILLKRLKIDMALNADATVQYAKDTQALKQNPKGFKFWTPITREDYKGVISTYNTYLHSGLPPGPICNPSLSSLKAVANANPNTPYLYYYHDSKGNSYYAKTLEEHEGNVAKYR